MTKSFTSKDAKRIINEHIEIRNKLESAELLITQYCREIECESEKLLAEEVSKILKNIPIEELNRNKNGFRIKSLRDYGYNSISDISSASVYNIASIRGISEDSAYAIKHILNDIIEQTKKIAKIKLSSDNKSYNATQLVKAVSKYKKCSSHIETCRQLLNDNKRKIDYALEDIAPSVSSVRWFFTSKLGKQKAQEAYNILSSLIVNEYGREANNEILALRNISNISDSEAWIDFEENSIQFFNILENIVPGMLGTNDSVYGLPEELAYEVQNECFFPEGLLCKLRRYQEWGVKYILHQEKVLLGDEMGLGKTIQAIAVMVSLKNIGATHFLVVCPASVIENWCREITKHSKLKVIKIHGNGRDIALKEWINVGNVAVTTYETTAYFKLEDSFRFTLLIVDEAHYIKNPDAIRTKNVKNISKHSDRLLYMTGTALENKVDEMISLIQMLQPNVASQIKNLTLLTSAPQFREKVATVYYRRKRGDVLTELPELIDSKEWCTMSNEEEQVYEQSVLKKNYSDVRRVSWNIDNLKYSTKAKRMLEIIDSSEADGRKVLIFSFFLDTIKKITLLLENKCLPPINGAVSPQRRQEIIDEFNKAPAGTVLAAQIQSGGTGLNIQSASVVILCEPQFKPSIENQAISRAYRMGQTRNVLVYRLLCENTVDERIIDILEEKQNIFDAFADKSVAAKINQELDDKTFGNIIDEEIKRINDKYQKKDS